MLQRGPGLLLCDSVITRAVPSGRHMGYKYGRHRTLGLRLTFSTETSQRDSKLYSSLRKVHSYSLS